jgi:hypothetical protein
MSGKYFNKGVKALDAPDIGHVARETPDKIAVFGGGDERYDTHCRNPPSWCDVIV